MFNNFRQPKEAVLHQMIRNWISVNGLESTQFFLRMYFNDKIGLTNFEQDKSKLNALDNMCFYVGREKLKASVEAVFGV